MPGWIGCVRWSRPAWPRPTNTAARPVRGQDWQRRVARRCDGAVEDGVAIVAAEAPRTSDEVNVQVSGTLRTSCARTDPRPGQAAPDDEPLAATLRWWTAARMAGGGSALVCSDGCVATAVVAAAVAGAGLEPRCYPRGRGRSRVWERRPRGRPPAHRRHPQRTGTHSRTQRAAAGAHRNAIGAGADAARAGDGPSGRSGGAS